MGEAERSNEDLFLKVCEEPLEGEKLVRNVGKVDFNAPFDSHPVLYGPFQPPHVWAQRAHVHTMSWAKTPEMSAATGAFRFSRKS